jgi:hypothetical protein
MFNIVMITDNFLPRLVIELRFLNPVLKKKEFSKCTVTGMN